jgi:iron(III) transport system substrate-binding protein
MLMLLMLLMLVMLVMVMLLVMLLLMVTAADLRTVAACGDVGCVHALQSIGHLPRLGLPRAQTPAQATDSRRCAPSCKSARNDVHSQMRIVLIYIHCFRSMPVVPAVSPAQPLFLEHPATMKKFCPRLFGGVLSSVTAACSLLAAALPAPAQAQDKVLNLYSARHYQTDEALYANFTKATGITINRIDADDAGILARLKAEGSASPADVVLLVDAARLTKAEAEGQFLPVKSSVLEARIPATLRGKDTGTGSTWFGFSTRARMVVFNKASVAKDDVDTYAELGEAKNKGRLCTRSGAHPYNLSLFGAMLDRMGPEKTEQWLQGLVTNMARAPKGGDTDQIKAVASGECQVALTNSYYLARLLRSDKPEDRAVIDKIGFVFPDQAGAGTHMNVAGGAVAANAKNRAAAVQFLEYLASDEAQNYFANGNNEWPAVRGLKADNPALKMMGDFKQDAVQVATVGANQAKVQQMLDRVGYK